MSQYTLDDFRYNDAPSSKPDVESDAKEALRCDNCNGWIVRYSYRINDGANYCSPECKNDATRTGEWFDCANCGDDVYVSPGNLGDSSDGYEMTNRFCNKSCESEWREANWRGHDHPSWRGGANLVHGVRMLLSDKSWHAIADDYRDGVDECEWCGDPPISRELDVHHLIPVSNGGTNGDWNLVALCIPCHRSAERHIEHYVTDHLRKYA